MGKVPKCKHLFLAHFDPNNQKIIYLTPKLPKFCVNLFCHIFTSKKWRNYDKKSEKCEEGPDRHFLNPGIAKKEGHLWLDMGI